MVFHCHSGKCGQRGDDPVWLNALTEALNAAGVARTALHWRGHPSAPQNRSAADAGAPAPNLPSPRALAAAQDRLMAHPRLLRLLAECVGLRAEQVAMAGIGWGEQERRYWLPVTDEDDNLLTIVRRDFREDLPRKRRKSLIWKGSSGAYLYVPFEVRPTGPVIVAAGERDCLALWALGMNAVCFTNGEGAVPSPERMVPLVGRDLVFAYDNDAGNHSKKVATALLPHAASIRIVDWSSDIPQDYDVWDILSDYGLGPDDYVFGCDGQPFNHGKWYLRSFVPATVEADLAPLRFHDLRHTYASLMHAQGRSMLEVSRWMGHGTYRITADIYSTSGTTRTAPWEMRSTRPSPLPRPPHQLPRCAASANPRTWEGPRRLNVVPLHRAT